MCFRKTEMFVNKSTHERIRPDPQIANCDPLNTNEDHVSDEGHVHLAGQVNKQNSRIWDTGNIN